MTDDPALKIYAEHASATAARWQSAGRPAEIFAPIADLLPPPPAWIADIRAGTGRGAYGWLSTVRFDRGCVEDQRDQGRSPLTSATLTHRSPPSPANAAWAPLPRKTCRSRTRQVSPTPSIF